VKERILVALRLEGATNKQLQQITGASEGTIRNKLSELRADGLITDDGKRPVTYQLVSSSPSLPPVCTGDDDTSNPTVSDLFAKPPEWLTNQLKVYRQNPERHFQPLCNTVAAEVLGDPLRGDEVREEVERELQQREV
jgi:DNA-binding HxlR family transcriptional regulator